MSFWHTVLTHNGQHLVDTLVASIKENEPAGSYQILIVDNGSDYPVKCPEASAIFYTGQNLSYSEASNLGVSEAARLGAAHVAILSDDVTFQTPHIAKAVDLLNFVDIVGPRTIFPDGRLQSAGHDMPDNKPFAVNLMDDVSRGRFVTSVMGSCIFTKPETWAKIGGFPLELKYFHEDVAAGLNAWKDGFLVWYEPSIGVVHLEGATRGRDIQTKMATAQRRKNWEQESISQALFEKMLKAGRWDIAQIKEKIKGLST